MYVLSLEFLLLEVSAYGIPSFFRQLCQERTLLIRRIIIVRYVIVWRTRYTKIKHPRDYNEMWRGSLFSAKNKNYRLQSKNQRIYFTWCGESWCDARDVAISLHLQYRRITLWCELASSMFQINTFPWRCRPCTRGKAKSANIIIVIWGEETQIRSLLMITLLTKINIILETEIYLKIISICTVKGLVDLSRVRNEITRTVYANCKRPSKRASVCKIQFYCPWNRILFDTRYETCKRTHIIPVSYIVTSKTTNIQIIMTWNIETSEFPQYILVENNTGGVYTRQAYASRFRQIFLSFIKL